VDTTDVVIRPAEAGDWMALGRLGAALVRSHFTFDQQRFMTPGPGLEEGYARFLESQRQREDVLVLVAADGDRVVGYLYAAVEPASWEELREEAGFIHDVAVEPSARRSGVATSLIDAAVAWFRARGTARVVLWTAHANEKAQALFEHLGFRRTMIEMTREL
jgi:ribosomal protein S18 acetylase RimI-like enzyme